MADKKTVDKVKELLETNAYAPLKEAAEKWLAAADEKYGDKFDDLKEKAAPTVAEIKEKAAPVMDEIKESVGELKDSYDEIKEKAAPAVAEFKEKAAPTVAELKEKADFQMSMSKMTFPHHLARVMLAEQIYRGFQIKEGTRYHK